MNWDIDWQTMFYNLTHVGLAYLLTLPIGWEREAHSRGAGLRTFPLVGMAACAYMLTGVSVFNTAEAHARVMYGIITGIGFIGGGAILKDGATISGTATAASIWNTGAIGVAVAMGQYEIAILLAAISYVTLRYVALLKRRTDSREES